MAFRVEILPVAFLDVEDAYLWWRENVPHPADAWWNGLYEAIFPLEEFPYRCALVPESEELEWTSDSSSTAKGRAPTGSTFGSSATIWFACCTFTTGREIG